MWPGEEDGSSRRGQLPCSEDGIGATHDIDKGLCNKPRSHNGQERIRGVPAVV